MICHNMSLVFFCTILLYFRAHDIVGEHNDRLTFPLSGTMYRGTTFHNLPSRLFTESASVSSIILIYY